MMKNHRTITTAEKKPKKRSKKKSSKRKSKAKNVDEDQSSEKAPWDGSDNSSDYEVSGRRFKRLAFRLRPEFFWSGFFQREKNYEESV